MEKLTIKDIAREAGVSITTVSRVLNNKEDGMTQKTREKVLKVMEELNYQPNKLARGLVTKRSNMLGLIVPNITNPYFPELCRGAEDEANNRQYSLIICNSDDQSGKEENYIRLLKEQQVDGILLSSKDRLSKTSKNQLQNGKIPYVLFDRGEDGTDYSGVFLDNEKGGYLAGKHLTDLGHFQIACMTGPREIQNSKQRLSGFQRALKEATVDLPASSILVGDFQMDTAYRVAKKFLRDNTVTAIFASNDLMACGIYQAAHEMGIQIPDQLSIVGFDDIPLVTALIPKLTTVRQNTYEMGRKAIDLLINKIEGEISEGVIFEPTLIIRESTKNYNEV
ncbi:LacI family DNA-binding transcriptional regulator [Psychrobacillus lasiicapitis]|uniref:LacI family transcriptional regulator n=1 Tax=Psychrobacillus lasiicapitis TaxID=1636719 RepID=A0A544T4Y3_9BACI|nr:LacI family DNA-binding transcriptional regulator [Psychrobacillus lasiicapitis]TQR12504.1 LacI family transcriptional regulator [Psychrobacillus lasiicapitis]GGA38655.1 LacI family transcriptional regulator [Psychrobacillus lasiicapitis]